MIGLRKDGTEFPMDLAVSEVPLKDKRLFAGIVRDITERILLEEQLVQSAKLAAVGRLISGIVREVNNPISIPQSPVSSLSLFSGHGWSTDSFKCNMNVPKVEHKCGT